MFKKNVMKRAHKVSENVFYENGVTEEEVDKFTYQDDIEFLGKLMQSKRHYGYGIDKDVRTYY